MKKYLLYIFSVLSVITFNHEAFPANILDDCKKDISKLIEQKKYKALDELRLGLKKFKKEKLSQKEKIISAHRSTISSRITSFFSCLGIDLVGGALIGKFLQLMDIGIRFDHRIKYDKPLLRYSKEDLLKFDNSLKTIVAIGLSAIGIGLINTFFIEPQSYYESRRALDNKIAMIDDLIHFIDEQRDDIA